MVWGDWFEVSRSMVSGFYRFFFFLPGNNKSLLLERVSFCWSAWGCRLSLGNLSQGQGLARSVAMSSSRHCKFE